MISREQREKDIIKLIEGLDIPQSLYIKAIEHYRAIAAFLQEHGIESDIYPQGSYALGTVVRPYRGDENAAYDLDAICEIKIDKDKTTAKDVKHVVGDELKSNETYRRMLQPEWDKCWTLEYAETNGIGFSVDVVPAVPETDINLEMVLESAGIDIFSSQISITHKNKNDYEWQTSNPKAYQAWFNKVNEPFLINQRNRLHKSFSGSMSQMNESTVEKIPEVQERSALQRVIQIVKYHADVYYSKGNLNNYKTASIVITTLITLLAQEVDASLEIFPLLNYIVEQLEVYGENLILNESEFVKKYQSKNVIRHINGQWILKNPLNPSENLVDSWNNDNLKPKYFFQWIKMLKSDYLTSMKAEDEYFKSILENNFGNNYVQKSLDLKKYTVKEPVNINITTKPYRSFC